MAELIASGMTISTAANTKSADQISGRKQYIGKGKIVLIARGSGEVLGNVFDFLSILNDVGCKRYVVTDNSADGALTGPNLNLIQKILERTDASIIASGGVGKISDIDFTKSLEISRC